MSDTKSRVNKINRLAFLVGLPVLALVGALALSGGAFNSPASAQETAAEKFTVFHSIDHAKVIGPDACKDCHKEAHAAWEKTPHHASLDKLREGKDIAEKMGMTRTYRREGLCLQCHTTFQQEGEELKAISGVSCESCHGGAKDWVATHNDYGPGATAQTETAEHKAARHKQADDLGMVRKDRVYSIAANCYSCHSVPNEKLVNTGGHKPGSDFELVAWSQGAVRHNYFGSTTNKEASQDRKRLLYVVGQATDLEMGLRGADRISEKGAYRDAMLARAQTSFAKLDAILKAVEIPELAAVITPLPRKEDGAVKLSKDLIHDTPDKLSVAIAAFVAAHDGSKLAGVDPMLPKPEQYKGTPAP